MSLFGVDIAKTVSDALNGQLKDAVLKRTNISDYDAINDQQIINDKQFTTQGIVDTYDKRLIADGLVQTNDRKILLLAFPLGTTPQPGDETKKADTIDIEGETFTVVSVERDPAGATWIIQGRL